MKKILSFLVACSLVSTTSAGVVSCSWKTPPLSIDKIETIMRVAKKQVLETTYDSENEILIPTFGDSIDWVKPPVVNDDYKTTIGQWLDSFTNKIAAEIATIPKDDQAGGLINQSKNLVTGEVVEDWSKAGVKSQTLELMKSSYLSVKLADLAIIEPTAKLENSHFWLSDNYHQFVTEAKKNEKKAMNNQRQSTDGFVANQKNYSLLNWLPEQRSDEWDDFWTNLETAKVAKMRFLIQFGPKSLDEPIMFFLDKTIK
ncbi:hypothetical protein JN01_0019 [Entomoplasma freundtii]|uniref:Uncharacterized protein n=1 Tax=Entomoplasma freundtii TaxID=74700 RepID=A0A2K8NR92_9MOLU|nr:hypothetical protein [Entomoplasma freundtii]ATZ16056.1 hypothetical protein EFREU_v1c00290 [Entomoplasma freundtii]TDY58075.1 hypothetical protein JN01_0019 [Entomoplasma freundtii]